ncbi:glycosyltransferase family 2 protein [Paenibacillus ihuae]|uniref:glycosyltransferase family 2 protein n=1 Tax=Paenibacillus ihuae TaxID=1232431 RepID=UPI0006D585C1|nr:glycosyltransferase [Paenibacillus ihuae]
MTNPPLVSVIVPSYNYEKFIVQSLESIVSQTYENLELVIVDDFSKDNSVTLINQLISQEKIKQRFDGKIQFIKHEVNRGAHFSINEGINASRGEYISILNADDLYDDNRFEVMMAAMYSQNAKFSFSKISVIDGEGMLVDSTNGEAGKFVAVQNSIQDFPTVGWSLIPHNAAISTGNMLFTREIYNNVGGFRNLKYCHDWDFILKSLILTEPLYIPETNYYYRLHGNNSYLQLDNVVDREVKTVLGCFFYKCRKKNLLNSLCPSPQNWKSEFLTRIENMSLQKFWLFSMTPLNLFYQLRQSFNDRK